MNTYRVVAERVDGWWAVSVPDLPGVFTQGRTWHQAQEMSRDAIATMLDISPDHVTVDLTPKLPAEAATVLDDLAEARCERARATESESAALRNAALRLKNAGISVRDAGAILGISYQRVSQLTNKHPKTA